MSLTTSSINIQDDKEKSNIKEEIKFIDIKPNKEDRFKKSKVIDGIREILKVKLENITSYQNDHIQGLCKEISESIRKELKSMDWNRYKYIVNVYIGERKNQGINTVNRMFWDKDTDSYITIPFFNNFIFSCTTIYIIYMY